MKKETIEKLAGLTAISTAMATSANAAILPSTTIPTGGLVSPTSEGTSNWDIDNDGTNEFSLNLSFTTSSSSFSYTYLRIGELGNTRVALQDGATADTFQKLSAGAKLGTASDALGFNPNGLTRIVASAYSAGVYAGFPLLKGGWSAGDTGYFGFKFTKDGNTHYGWAEMTLSSSSASATINEAWYNDTPDGAVTVGVVPEPAHVGLGLGALALGAAGLRRMRQRGK